MNHQTTVAGTPEDPTSRFTTLELGGKTYYLCFDFDAIAKAETMAGIPLLFGVDWAKITAPRLRAMLCACALKAHPDAKPEDFTRYITHRNILKIQTAVIDAWVDSTPDAEENAADQNPPTPQPSPANG